jgi:hypothetical protein
VWNHYLLVDKVAVVLFVLWQCKTCIFFSIAFFIRQLVNVTLHILLIAIIIIIIIIIINVIVVTGIFLFFSFTGIVSS